VGLVHVVSLLVHPVHGVSGTHCTCGRVPAFAGWSGMCDIDSGGVTLGVGDSTLEGCHVHLVGTSVRLVHPEPSALTHVVGASWQVGNLKCL